MYICLRCSHEFNRSSNFYKHLKKENKCEAKYLNISRKDLLNDYNTTYNKCYNQYLTCKENYIEKIKEIICEKCNKKFSRKCNYYTHQKKYCKVIKNEKIIYDLLKLEYEEKMNEFSAKLEKEIEDNNKHRQDLENKIAELESKMIPYTQTTNNGHVGDNNINNGHVGDNNITIINNFGSENISSIDKAIFEKIVATDFSMIQNLINYIHIFIEENRNILATSHKDKYAMVLKDQKWNLVDKNKLIDDLIIEKHKLLQSMLTKYSTESTLINPNRIQAILHLCLMDDEELKKVKTDTQLNLINGQQTVRDTYEIKYGQKVKIT